MATALLNTLLALDIQMVRFPRAIPKELEAAISLNIREILRGNLQCLYLRLWRFPDACKS